MIKTSTGQVVGANVPNSGWVDYGWLKAQGIVSNRVTLRRWIARGWFPAPIAVSPHLNRWLLAEVRAWEAAKIAERDAARAA